MRCPLHGASMRKLSGLPNHWVCQRGHPVKTVECEECGTEYYLPAWRRYIRKPTLDEIKTIDDLKKTGCIYYHESTRRKTLSIETYPSRRHYLNAVKIFEALQKLGALKHRYTTKGSFSFENSDGSRDTFFEHDPNCPCLHKRNH